MESRFRNNSTLSNRSNKENKKFNNSFSILDPLSNTKTISSNIKVLRNLRNNKTVRSHLEKTHKKQFSEVL